MGEKSCVAECQDHLEELGLFKLKSFLIFMNLAPQHSHPRTRQLLQT